MNGTEVFIASRRCGKTGLTLAALEQTVAALGRQSCVRRPIKSFPMFDVKPANDDLEFEIAMCRLAMEQAVEEMHA
jgi:hypothetical protein